ncbi:MAG TPA: autotransporter strand-loop-strand O-heptosyltransferase [Caulobacteraceae bacterium]|nr:autotransporter strand-loop-strand O-heptosyltransferase [Caulobacteraceae bacterium]
MSGDAAKPKPKSKPKPPPAYPQPTVLPTQEGPRGVRYDFNLGCRVALPKREDGEWLVRLRDLETGNVLFESRNRGSFVASSKRFFVRFCIEVSDGETEIFRHDYDCRDREVLILFPLGTLGDTMAWFPYAARFGEVHGCKLTIAMSGLIIPLLKDNYPNINFVTHEELAEQKLTETAYATYCMGLFFDDKDNVWQPTDFRMVGLHRTAAYILGVDPAEEAPRVTCSAPDRPIAEPYVVIAVQSSSGCKMWNNPTGWREVVSYLKAKGYRVICIDQKPVHGAGLLYYQIPHGCEDETGDRPLTERARWITHADAFVGLSSGLAWLAWACGAPSVVISGFTHPTNEFATPYRVFNWHTCNSCWNDPALRFKHDDFMWCPRHQNTSRHFECTRLITTSHVISTIDRALAENPTKGQRMPRVVADNPVVAAAPSRKGQSVKPKKAKTAAVAAE